MYNASCGNDFVKDIQVSLIERFFKIATHSCFIGRIGHLDLLTEIPRLRMVNPVFLYS
jgi:hypothetical protein